MAVIAIPVTAATTPRATAADGQVTAETFDPGGLLIFKPSSEAKLTSQQTAPSKGRAQVHDLAGWGASSAWAFRGQVLLNGSRKRITLPGRIVRMEPVEPAVFVGRDPEWREAWEERLDAESRR